MLCRDREAGMTMGDDEAWLAFERRDRSADGRFVVAVTTTRIYCRPSCPARRPKRENVRMFGSNQAAEEAGFRPCLRCKPDAVARDDAALERAKSLIEHSGETLRLDRLASEVSYAPHHFQRLFTRRFGLSPAAYQRAVRLERARVSLGKGGRVTDAIYEAGYSAPSRFYEDAKALAMPPANARDGGRGQVIRWARANSPFGPLLVAATERGLCRLSFEEDEAELRRRYPAAEFIEDVQAPLIQAALAAISDAKLAASLPVDVPGTAFQQRVWAELRKIPAGETRSYLDIARALGDPKATRAVGSANGANPVAIIVPCHRVLRNDGAIGGYAGGVERKRALLAAETKVAQGSLPLLS
jgi:AraC family transcriptional regulator of adaptative response/methylated-DNA-[protein]-cysteine methyltransferase